MYRRPFVLGIVLLAATSLGAQTVSASAAAAPPDPAQQSAQHAPQLRSVLQDPVDAKIEQALRGRDAELASENRRVHSEMADIFFAARCLEKNGEGGYAVCVHRNAPDRKIATGERHCITRG
jgi:hypothetical protein